MLGKKKSVLLIVSGWGLSSPSPANTFSLANKPNIDFLFGNFPTFQLNTPTDHRFENLRSLTTSKEISGMGHRLVNSLNSEAFKKHPVIASLIRHAAEYNSKLHILIRVDHFGSLSYKYSQKIVEILKHSNLRTHQINFHYLLNNLENTELKNKFILELTEQVRALKIGEIGGLCLVDKETVNSSVLDICNYLINSKAKTVTSVAEILKSLHKTNSKEMYIISHKEQPFAPMNAFDAVLDLNIEGDQFSEVLRQSLEATFEEDFAEQSEGTKLMYANLSDLPTVHDNIIVKDYVPDISISRFLSQSQVYQSVITSREDSEEFLEAINLENKILPGQDVVNVYEVNYLREQRIIFEKINEKIIQDKYGLITAYLTTLFNISKTGKVDEAIECIESLDNQIAELANIALHNNSSLIITSDVGLAEAIYNSKGEINSGSNNPVPGIFIDQRFRKPISGDGHLKDLVPTLLNVSGHPKPAKMEGVNLFNF